MKPVIEVVNVDEQRAEASLREAAVHLSSGGEITLDFSSVRRIGPRAFEELETLAELAREKAVKIALRGVNINLYKALKLLDATHRFTFRSEEQAL